MPNTRSIAAHQPEEDCGDDETAEDAAPSEKALSNFALLCARPIVEAFDGRLIYAGGDDVVALAPAETALACVEGLRAAFTGREVKSPSGDALFSSRATGFLSTDKWKDDHGRGPRFHSWCLARPPIVLLASLLRISKRHTSRDSRLRRVRSEFGVAFQPRLF
jgi:hypothetical protein